MSCGKGEVFTSVREIFFKAPLDSGKTIDMPSWAGDRDCDTPQLKNVIDGRAVTVGQVLWQVNLEMDTERAFPGSGRRQIAEDILRKYGATDKDIQNLLG